MKKVYKKVIEMYEKNPERPLRDYKIITYYTKKGNIRNLSLGYVHKILAEIKREKPGQISVQKKGDL